MGLLKATLSSLSGLLSEQWRDFYQCDSIDSRIMIQVGKKQISNSSNKNSSSNIITDGSIITVAEGQCAITTEQGKIMDVCAEPGAYIYKTDLSPSIFVGKLNKETISKTYEKFVYRFGFGGEPPIDQKVYYFNLKEFTSNPYGTISPIPFRIIDKNIGLDMDIAVRCYGEYSYKITNPILFFKNVSGNVDYAYMRENIDSQLKSELLTSLQVAFAKISELGVRYSAIPKYTNELADNLNLVLSEKWKNHRGIEISSIGISSIKATENDEKIIKELQRNSVFKDPNMAAAQIVASQSIAMEDAAKNTEAGALMAFMGLKMASNIGGFDPKELYNLSPMINTKNEQSWCCRCGTSNTGNYCSNCGLKRDDN